MSSPQGVGSVTAVSAGTASLRGAADVAVRDTDERPLPSARADPPSGRHEDGRSPGGGRSPRPADVPALLVLAAFAALLIGATWNTWGNLGMDTGYDLLAAARVDHGDYPYLDFFYFYGPLGPALLGQLFAAFGASIGVAVAFGLAFSVAILAATFALARALAGVPAALLAGALTATAAFSTANNSYVMPHSLSAPLAILFVLGALLAALATTRRRGSGWPVLAGVCAGAVTLTRPEFAAAVFAALGLWLMLRCLDHPDRRAALREVALVAGPALAIPVVVYGLALTQMSAHDLFLANLYPTDFLREAGSIVIDEHLPLTLASLVKLAGLSALYAAGAGATVAAGVAIARGGRARLLALLAVAATTLALLAALALRPEFIRFKLEYVYAWIPAGAWLAVGLVLWRFFRREGRWSAVAQAELLALVTLAVLVTKGYADFAPYPLPDHPQDAAYALPFAGAFLTWLHLRELPRGRRPVALLGAGWLALLVIASTVLVLRDAGSETVTVRAAHGSIAASPADGPAYQAAVDVIARDTRPGDAILLAPQMTALYVMTGRQNPLPELSLLPGMLDAKAEQRAIRTLEVRDVRLVITDRAPQTTYRQGAFGVAYAQRLGRWIRSSFTRATVLRGDGPDPRELDVWTRRTP